MTIKENFLNANITFDENVTEEKRIEITNQINEIKNIVSGKDSDITLTKDDIENLCKWFNIDTATVEGRDFIKEILQNSDYQSGYSYPVVFTNNLLYVDNQIVENFIQSELTEDVTRELIQLLALIKLEKEKPLQEIAIMDKLTFDSVFNLNEIIKYEKEIENKIKNSVNFKQLIGFVSPFGNDFSFTEEGKKVYEKVMYELEKLLFLEPENENLIEFYGNKICFNEYSFNEYQKIELNDDRKRELIQSLYMIESNQEKDVSEYSENLPYKKENIINFLKRKVSKEEIEEAITKLPNERVLLIEKYTDKISDVLKVKDNKKFILFEQKMFNEDMFKELLNSDYKEDQIILYFIILCAKENKEIYCNLIDNEQIKFSEFEKYFYIEDILQKKLSEYTLSDILTHLHDFKKDKIFTKENEMIIDNIISENLVKKYSFNTTNKEVLFINSSRCIFNEKLMSKINEMDNNQLTQLYLMTNDTLVKELSENIIVDKRVSNIKNYQDELRNTIKYKVTEIEVKEAIENIEIKSNTLISSKNEIFQQTSIEINAKEVKELSNDIVEFSYRNQELYLYSFNKMMCDKLLKKELVELSKREFIQALFLLEIQNKNMLIKNPEGNEIKIHDNFKEVESFHDLIIDKVINQITEEEIDKSLKIIADKMESSIKDSLQYTINNLKKKCGIKVKSTFKHIL